MLNKIKNRKQEGFTIIEVLIVLAIAGLILLIVLLAVPALQRNSRNTTIKNDASALAGGVSEFSSNNEGQLPTPGGSNNASGTVTINNASGTPATAKVQGSTAVHFEATGSPTAANYAVGNIDVDFGYKCTNSTGAAVTGSPRSTAVIYSVETATSSSPKCIDS